MTYMLNLKEVINRTGICRTVIYEMMQSGEFPKSIPLTKRTVRWVDSDVESWIQNKILSARQVKG
jgi:prophage regulatory protein